MKNLFLFLILSILFLVTTSAELRYGKKESKAKGSAKGSKVSAKGSKAVATEATNAPNAPEATNAPVASTSTKASKSSKASKALKAPKLRKISKSVKAPIVTKASKDSKSSQMGRVELHVTNLAYRQPFSGFFVMVHSKETNPIFTFGEEASVALKELAEDGNVSALVDYYEDMDGVCEVMAHSDGAPYFGGNTTVINVTGSSACRHVTIAAMAINTNDCFVALNGANLVSGVYHYADGLDAGTEINSESCDDFPIPTTACDDGGEGNNPGDGEGFVHVHRGIHGGADIDPATYDWRNPMMKVSMN